MSLFKYNLKIIFTLMLLLCFSFIGMNLVYANTIGSTPVTYNKFESVKYPLYIDVSGDGEVSTGKETLRNQEKQYWLPVDETITFQLKADKGAKIKSIKLNGKNVEGNKIVVEGAEKEQRVSVNFVRNTNGIKFPYTGDIRKIGLSILMIVLSIIGIIYMYYRNRKQENFKS